jgi:hypothetical protein
MFFCTIIHSSEIGEILLQLLIKEHYIGHAQTKTRSSKQLALYIDPSLTPNLMKFIQFLALNIFVVSSNIVSCKGGFSGKARRAVTLM